MEDFKNFEKEKLTISVVKANLYGLLLIIPVAFLFGVPFYQIWGNFSVDEYNGFTILLVLIGGIIAHELIHGITWASYAKEGFRSIKFGVMWKMLTPYCHCKEPLMIRYYLLGAIMPAVLLGILPAIVSIIVGSPGLLYFGIFFTVAGIGDFMIIRLLRKENPNDFAQDHPSEAGCIVYRGSGKT